MGVQGHPQGSVAVLVAGVVIVTTGYTRADALASVAIGVMILPRAWSLLRDLLDVLLEATPRGVDLVHVRDHISSLPGVVDVHDLHAWTSPAGCRSCRRTSWSTASASPRDVRGRSWTAWRHA